MLICTSKLGLTSWIKCSGQTGCQGLSECNRPKWIQRDTGYSKEPAGFINDFDKKEEPAGSACGGIGDECTGDECTGDDCIEKYADNTKPCDARCVDCKPQSVVEMKLRYAKTLLSESWNTCTCAGYDIVILPLIRTKKVVSLEEIHQLREVILELAMDTCQV